MIDNTHCSVYLLCPSKGLAARKEQALADQLAEYKASLSEEELEQLIAATEELKQYQSEPSPKEILEMIPLLTIDDIRKEAEPIYNKVLSEEGIAILQHEIETNRIAYVDLLFDISHIDAEVVPYLGILTEVLGNMNTDHYTYQELTDEVNLYTGGLRTAVNIYGLQGSDTYKPRFEMSGKVLYSKVPKMFELFEDILLHTHFDDEKRLKEILNQLKSRLEMGFMSNGHSTAVNRAMSYFNQGSWYKELVEGIAFYQFLCAILKDYDTRKTKIIHKLQTIGQKIFRKAYLMADMTVDHEGMQICTKPLVSFAGKLYTAPMSAVDCAVKTIGTCPRHNEAFITSGMVQYNACVGNFGGSGMAYSGSMNVLKNVLGNEYLWNNVRVKGGAYGCMCGFAPSGNGYFTSYRDPNLAKTYDIYANAADYVRSLALDDRELTKYIIGAVGAIDLPMTASMKGNRSLAAFLGERSFEQIQKNRDELLATTVDDLRGLSKAVASVIEAGHICVVGSESKITEEKDRFEYVAQLTQ